MPNISNDLIPKIFEIVKNAVSMFLLIVVFSILQYIFNMHFVCSCKEGVHVNGVLYMIVPPLILIFVVNIAEPFHRRKIFSSRCWFISKSYKKSFCSYVIKMIIKYIGLTAVWDAVVLFDGDWYICLKTNLNKSQTGIPCYKTLTFEQELIKNGYKNESLDLGFYVICAFLLLWSICEIRAAYCKSKRQCCRPRPYYSVVYEELLAEQVSVHLNDELKKIATKKAKAICRPYLQVIKNHELPVNNRNDDAINKFSESWETISSSHFYSMECNEEEVLLTTQRNRMDTPGDGEADFYMYWFFG